MTPPNGRGGSTAVSRHRAPSLKELAAAEIRQRIFSGALRPGSKVDQDAIAADLGMSKLPIREALITLDSEGLVRNIPRRGAFVAPLTRDDIRDHYHIFGTVVGIAAERAAEHLDDDELQRLQELADAMEAKGTEVDYGIHPVAGRMPGHMNVLLAEAEVPYDKLVEMDRINPTFEDTDVVIIIGANDVTNPMARESEGSPIYGMPILNVDKAKNVVVIKRSLSPGFAGLPNPLFAMDHTLMVYGDGKKAVIEMTTALNQA